MIDRRITGDELLASGYPDTRKMVIEIMDARTQLAAKDAQIAALRALLRVVMKWVPAHAGYNALRARVDAALEMSGGVL